MKLYEYRVALRGDNMSIQDTPPMISDATSTEELDVAICEHARHWCTSEYWPTWDIEPHDLLISVERSDPWRDPLVVLDPTPVGLEPPILTLRAEITSG